MKIVITGGSGFIGTNLINFLNKKKYRLLNIDKLGYASTPEKFKVFKNKKNYSFLKLNICNYILLKKKLDLFNPDIIVNLAANSHVDRSIAGPKKFFNENVSITQNILEWLKLNNNVKLIHISTDEVYGSTKKNFFKENDILDPSSPYSASKASSDILIKSYSKTYNLRSSILRFCNNFGPYQFTEKYIPTILSCIYNNSNIPIYGKGTNVREWIYVEDTCKAIEKFILNFEDNQIYNIGSSFRYNNIQLAKLIISKCSKDTKSKISFVRDRAAHDYRYALNSSKFKKRYNWKVKTNFLLGLTKTITWYNYNREWVNNTKKEYKGQRLG